MGLKKDTWGLGFPKTRATFCRDRDNMGYNLLGSKHPENEA